MPNDVLGWPELSTRTEITGKLLADIRDAIRGTHKRIDQVVTRLDSHDRILLRMADELGGMNGRLDRVEGRLGRVEGRLDRVEARLDRLDARVGGLEHQQRVSNVRLGALVEVIRLAVDRDSGLDATIQALRERVEQLERR